MASGSSPSHFFASGLGLMGWFARRKKRGKALGSSCETLQHIAHA